MPLLFKKRLGFFCLLAFVACQSSGSQKPTPKMPPSEIKETKAVGVPPQSSLKNCEDVFKKAAAESILTFYPETKTAKIEVNSNKIYDEESLSRWAMDLAKAVFTEPACTVDKISFVAMVSADVYYQGLLLRSDYDFFKREKISLAEWMRRLDIKELNTVASVKTKLKKARDAKEHDKALDLAKQWIDLEPNNETAKLVLANIYLDEASYFEAIMRYEDLIKIKPDNALVLFNLAYAKTRIGSFSEAIALYEKVQTSDSDDVFWLNFTEANLSDHRLSEAEKALEPVKDKERLDFVILSANLKRARKDYAGAKELLDTLVSRGDDKDLVFFNLVVLALDMKDEKAAQLAFVSLQTRNAKMAEELSFLSVFGSKQQTPDTTSSAVDEEKEESDVTMPEIEETVDEGDLPENENHDEPLF
jgi:tetratricopeptide (TPR) repeat protein